MNDFRNSCDSRPRPVYRDRRSQPGRPRTAPKKNLFANKSPEGSEQWHIQSGRVPPHARLRKRGNSAG